MEKLVVHGGFTLRGAVNISGSKNASLPILAASLLTDEPVVVRRVPDVSDTNFMVQIMGQLGASVERSSGNVRVEARSLHSEAAYEQVRKMRASICLMGPLMARMQRCVIPLPGGCVIGDRPVDLHIRAIQALGAQVQIERGNLIIEAPRGLKGATVDLSGDHGPTVLGTDNLMMAAVLAEGTTVIESAASEPEVVDLANFLNSMGANVKGAGTDVIRIRGVHKLHGTEYSIIPDQIEAGTFMCAAAITRGDVMVQNVIPKHLEATIAKLVEIGCEVEEFDDAVRVVSKGDLHNTQVKTLPYPGFPTDMQPQIGVTLALCKGTSTITESIFENRFKYLSELARMGANVKVEGNAATIEGVDKFSGARVSAPDLRAGAALVIAGMAADGITIVDDIVYIQRGYERFEEKLRSLGAVIERVSTEREIQKFKLKVG